MKHKIYIHYLKNRGGLDSTHICVCLILRKTIQLVPYLEIVDILALRAKMVNFVESIHDFEIRLLLDSAIHLYLITLPELLVLV